MQICFAHGKRSPCFASLLFQFAEVMCMPALLKSVQPFRKFRTSIDAVVSARFGASA
jgi:hypothetical protein